MTDLQTVATTYIDLWNENDREARRALLAAHWTPGATYIDPMAAAQGPAEISDLIASVQDRFPGFRFRLLGQPDGHGPNLRFSWGLGPDGAEPPIKGTDFATLQEGRLASVVGFLDALPSGAA